VDRRREQQQTLHSFYDKVSREDKERGRRREYLALERKLTRGRRERQTSNKYNRRQQHRRDRTIGITTQNVRGLATHMVNLGNKLQGFKEQHMRCNRDVIMIQEIHLTRDEHERAARQYVTSSTQWRPSTPFGHRRLERLHW
jgi:hypothetical protein